MNPRSSSISVTGIGAVTCAGLDLESFWQNALGEKTGLSDSGLGSISDADIAKLRSGIPNAANLSRPTLLAIAAIQAAMKQAGWNELREDDGLIIATTVGQLPLWENELSQYIKKEISADAFGKVIVHQSLSSIIETISGAIGFRGKSLLVTSACSASTQAIGLASLWIKQGRVKRCLVGGTEVLSKLTVEGFRSLQLFSSQKAQPFDLNRKGINLSEGAGFFCLEADSERSLAEISGSGFSTDAYHMAAPHPEGRGSFEAMKMALAAAKISPADVTWVHAHGTGSNANDQSEGVAIAALFEQKPWVSSTKWIHGHALGASGAIETALCIRAMRENTILRTAGLVTPDPKIPLQHLTENLKIPIHHIVKNTLGFGGNNAALVLSAVPR